MLAYFLFTFVSFALLSPLLALVMFFVLIPWTKERFSRGLDGSACLPVAAAVPAVPDGGAVRLVIST